MNHTRKSRIARACLGAGLLWGSLPLGAAAQNPRDMRPSITVVADPQIHNIYGGKVKQTLLISDLISKVAQRHPETNLLAGYVFQDLVDRANRDSLGSETGLVLLLGDGTNAGCTGEYDQFDAFLKSLRDKKKIVLWAHGNHDSYLMGTSNTYFPVKSVLDSIAVKRLQDSDRPLDLSWWKKDDNPVGNNWNSLCADGAESVPINKGQWIARYLKSFGEHLEQTKPEDSAGVYSIQAHGAASSPLAARNFQIRGRWYPPKNPQDGSNDFTWTYNSYIVQAIDIGETHRLILIDTSVCENTGWILGFKEKNAGTNGCISSDELKDIRELAKDSSRRLVIGGHFPLHKLIPEDRDSLLSIFNTDHRRWSYLSGHTHSPESWRIGATNGVSYSGVDSLVRYDLNVGSTTDWPMEAHRIAFDSTERGMVASSVGYLGASRLWYVPPPSYQGLEICRHLKVAQELAKLPTGVPFRGPWKSPATNADYKACENQRYKESVKQLLIATDSIKVKMNDPLYRDAMLRIAVSASVAQDATFDVEKVSEGWKELFRLMRYPIQH